MTEAQRLAYLLDHRLELDGEAIQAAAAELRRLEAECEALRTKAARYDSIQEKMRGAVPLVRVLKMYRGTYIHLTSLEQIDAAMGKEIGNG